LPELLPFRPVAAVVVAFFVVAIVPLRVRLG
jgi:hypothetical protein